MDTTARRLIDSREPMASHAITVVIADDHPLVRFAVRQRLEMENDVQVVGEAVNGEEALARVEDERPDVVILDYRMPIVDGLQAARAIGGSYPDIRVIMLTGEEDHGLVSEAARAGVHGLISKDHTPERLLDAIRLVMSGGMISG
jgi:DNA-binding NarL/FixJ family response regulator